jgi:predicted DNA-binding protein YlxM (UPF0122 family)
MAKRPIKRKGLTFRNIRTKSEKESRVVDLYENQDYTVAEICAEEHISATTASKIIKKFNKLKEPSEVSARSKAFELFKLKTSLVDVAAKLDLSADQTQAFFAEYQRLCGLDEYVTLFFKTEGDISYYLGFYKECQELRISPATAIEAIAMSKSLSWIQKQREIASQELKNIQSTMPSLKGFRDSLEKESEHLKFENELLKMDKRNLENDIAELKSVEQAYKNSEYHQTVKEIATVEATRILANKAIERIEARVTIANVIRQNPELLPVLYPPSEGYYNPDLERMFNALLEKSLDEGHREYMMIVLPSVVTKLDAGIDEYHKNNTKQEGGTAGENQGLDNQTNNEP